MRLLSWDLPYIGPGGTIVVETIDMPFDIGEKALFLVLQTLTDLKRLWHLQGPILQFPEAAGRIVIMDMPVDRWIMKFHSPSGLH